jgi:hypothetical protein
LFESLAQVKGVRLFSLQVGPGTDQLEEFREKWQIVDLGFKAEPHPEAFLETGAAIKNLDLVISCDTSVVHVAGALAHPVWVAISYVPDWRWLLDGETTKWYPTMRLFRQNRPLEWEPVFKRLAQELEKEVNRPAASGMFGINVGAGELLDRMIILELKAEYLEHAETRNAILGELERLTATRERILRSSPELKALADDLWAANQSLWEIHNNLRGCERKKDFGNRFVELARSLARENDRRSDLKRQINELVGSSFPELKTYRQPEPARKAGAKGS